MKPKKSGCLRFTLWGLLALMVLCLSTAGGLAWDNSRLAEHSEMIDRLSPREKGRLIEAQHLRHSVGDEVLPGWGQAEIPLILYNEEYAFLSSVGNPPPDGWATVPRGEQRGAAWEVTPGDDLQGQPYYRQKLAAGVTPQAFTVQVGDDYAASITTLEYFRISMHEQLRGDLPGVLQPFFPYRFFTGQLLDSSDQYITLILHEAAHAYQGLVAPERLAAGEQANHDTADQYPWDDKRLRQNWQSELDVLARALRAKTEQETRALAGEFLQIRQSRRQSAGLSAEAVEFERSREWVEGIGRYAELSVYRLPRERTGYISVGEIFDDPEFHHYERYDQRWSRELDQMRRMANDEGDGRFYYSGMAQAVLLDRLGLDWKSRLFEPGVWLEDLLAEALRSPGS